jgi:GTP 3',8-cyclase
MNNMIKTLKCIMHRFPYLYDQAYKIYLFLHGMKCLMRYGDFYLFTGVSIEISTYCNRRCEYCPNHYNEPKKEYMKEEIFHKIIQDLAAINFSGTVSYVHYNEPLLDERLPKFIAYTKSQLPKSYVKIITNGDYLTPYICSGLIAQGADEIYITLHDKGASALHSKWNVIRNLFGEHVTFDSLHDKPKSNRAGLVQVGENLAKGKCPYPQGLIIDHNGNLLLCCNDYFCKHGMGNVMDKPLMEIWWSQKWLDLRSDMRKGQFYLPICVRCVS